MDTNMKQRVLNTIFPLCEDKCKQLEPITFNVPATYNINVKIHDWQMYTMAEPRDNVEFFPPKGSLQLASYNRIGSDQRANWTTETHDMLAQIELKDEYRSIQPQRTLVNMQMLASMAAEAPQEDLRMVDVMMEPGGEVCPDYRTTTIIDYRAPYPMKRQPPPSPPSPEPWILNRRTLSSCNGESLGMRPGYNKFLDDNMEIHDRVRIVKAQRRRMSEIYKLMQHDSNVGSKPQEGCLPTCGA